MDLCKDELSEKEILHFLIQLWHAIRDVENRYIVKWVKGGRVFKIVNVRRFFSEVCPDLCDECTPAYFEYFMICCGFEAIPPRFVEYYHKDFLKYDYSRIERVRAECTLLTPKAYNLHLEENSELLTFDFNDKTFAQVMGLKNELTDKVCNNEETWPDPEDLPESPLTPEATDLSSESIFFSNTFPSDMLLELDSMMPTSKGSSLESTSCSKSSVVEKAISQPVQSAISLNDLKSSLKLNLVHCLSIDPKHTDDSSSQSLTSPLPNHFHQRGFETNFESSSCDLSKSMNEIDLDTSSPSPPESLSSPNVSPLSISKLRDFPLNFDPSDPFNLFYNKPVFLKARTRSSFLTRSHFSSIVTLDSQTLQNSVPIDPPTLANSAPMDPPTLPNSGPLDPPILPNSPTMSPTTISSSIPLDIPTFPITTL